MQTIFLSELGRRVRVRDDSISPSTLYYGCEGFLRTCPFHLPHLFFLVLSHSSHSSKKAQNMEICRYNLVCFLGCPVFFAFHHIETLMEYLSSSVLFKLTFIFVRVNPVLNTIGAPLRYRNMILLFQSTFDSGARLNFLMTQRGEIMACYIIGL